MQWLSCQKSLHDPIVVLFCHVSVIDLGGLVEIRQQVHKQCNLSWGTGLTITLQGYAQQASWCVQQLAVQKLDVSSSCSLPCVSVAGWK